MKKSDNLVKRTRLRKSIVEKIEVCRDMVSNNINLNALKASDTYNYNGKTYNIGRWLMAIRGHLHSQAVKEALMELGVKFDKRYKMVDSDLKIKIVRHMVSHDMDINSIPQYTKYRYKGEEYNVGIWLFTSKYYGADPKFMVELERLGFDFSKNVREIRRKVDMDTKLEVIRHMLDTTHQDINKINTNYTYIYKGVEYTVGQWLKVARHNKCGPLLLSKLRELGFTSQNLYEESNAFKVEVLTDMKENGYNMSKIKGTDTYTYKGVEYDVGKWVYSFGKSCNSDILKSGLEKLGIQANRKNRVEPNARFEIIDDMVAKGIDINELKSNYIYNYKGKDYKVGSWLAKARSGQTTQEFIDGLAKYNFNFDKKSKYYDSEFKIEVIKDMLAHKININKTSMTTKYKYKGETYDVGIWLYHARINAVDKDFVEALRGLGLKIKKPEEIKTKIGKTKKLEILRDLKSKGEDITKIQDYDIYEYQGVEYPVGQWLHDTKRPHYSEKLYQELADTL